MKARSGKNWLPDKHNKAVPITDRRDLEDVICLEVEGGPETKCESVEWHISNMIAVFAPLVMDRAIHLTRSSWKYFKEKLEIYAPQLNRKYQARRKGRKAYRERNRLEESLRSTGEPPEGFRRLSDDDLPSTDEANNPKT